MLYGKSILITGVATEDSIATASLRTALELGATVRATAYPRDLDMARDVISGISDEVAVDALDFTDGAAVDRWLKIIS